MTTASAFLLLLLYPFINKQLHNTTERAPADQSVKRGIDVNRRSAQTIAVILQHTLALLVGAYVDTMLWVRRHNPFCTWTLIRGHHGGGRLPGPGGQFNGFAACGGELGKLQLIAVVVASLIMTSLRRC